MKYCAGCRNNFYNDKNPLGVKQCWSLKAARVVTRFRIGWWTQPTSREAFRKVRTLNCHSAPGQYADFEKLPAHLVTLKRRAASPGEIDRG